LIKSWWGRVDRTIKRCKGSLNFFHLFILCYSFIQVHLVLTQQLVKYQQKQIKFTNSPNNDNRKFHTKNILFLIINIKIRSHQGLLLPNYIILCFFIKLRTATNAACHQLDPLIFLVGVFNLFLFKNKRC